MIKFTILINIYRGYIDVYIGDSIRECLDYFNKKHLRSYIEDFKDNGIAVCYNRGRQILMFSKKDLKLNIILHEIMHAVFNLLDNRGIVYCKESEESFTYLCDYIYNEILKGINKNIKDYIPSNLIEK